MVLPLPGTKLAIKLSLPTPRIPGDTGAQARLWPPRETWKQRSRQGVGWWYHGADPWEADSCSPILLLLLAV